MNYAWIELFARYGWALCLALRRLTMKTCLHWLGNQQLKQPEGSYQLYSFLMNQEDQIDQTAFVSSVQQQ